jgi:hypothetical protein
MTNKRIGIVLGLVLLLAAVPAGAEKKPMADEFTGVFISMNAPDAMGSQVRVWVESYTADDVAQKLAATLAESGQKGLLDAITDLRIGTIRIGTASGYPISVARQRPNADGSRTVFLATSRPLVGFQPRPGAKIDDYPFGIIELKLGPDGKGEGTIVGAAQLSFDESKRNLNIASYATEPGRISDLKTKPQK